MLLILSRVYKEKWDALGGINGFLAGQVCVFACLFVCVIVFSGPGLCVCLFVCVCNCFQRARFVSLLVCLCV